MTEPTTVNIGLVIPNTGDLVGTWGTAAINPDMSALDGYFGGVQTISVSNAPVVLTSPAGFTPSSGGGPVQSQNAVIKFTGTMSAPVQVTLPVPGYYICENLTTGAFVLSFRAIGSGQVIAVDQGEVQHLYNDGTNVKFVNLGRIGHEEMWDGLIAMPAWVTACTVPPYVLADGSIYNFSTYPYLGARFQGNFGGNGITTFGVPDRRGRMGIPYVGTGTGITSAGSGINGQTLGAAADNQSVTLTSNQIPAHNHGVTDPGHTHTFVPSTGNAPNTSAPFLIGGTNGVTTFSGTNPIQSATTGISTQNTGGGLLHTNVQPSIVTGICVIRAA
jgi:microcystin-dependent protein